MYFFLFLGQLNQFIDETEQNMNPNMSNTNCNDPLKIDVEPKNIKLEDELAGPEEDPLKLEQFLLSPIPCCISRSHWS